MKIDLTGKVALVTGGTSGIGAAICEALSEAGAKVATNYLNEEKAQEWLKETGGRVLILRPIMLMLLTPKVVRRC